MTITVHSAQPTRDTFVGSAGLVVSTLNRIAPGLADRIVRRVLIPGTHSGEPPRGRTAPARSASTAVLPIGISKGGATTLPPSWPALSVAASTPSTQKSTLQCDGASWADRSGSIGDMIATTSRDTGCCGSPPT